MKLLCVVYIGIFFLIPVSLQGMKFIQSISTKRQELEEQIVVLTKAGNDLLSTGALLQKELLNEVAKQKKDLAEKKEFLKLPYSIVVEPFQSLAHEIAINPDLAKAPPFRDELLKFIQNDIFQKAYLGLFEQVLKIIKIPSLPDVLKTLMALLNTVDSSMSNVAAKFEPIVLQINSYVDIEQAKKDLQLPVNSYTSVNLEFVNTYRDYVNKIYAEKTGGKKFDERGIYSGLWSAIQNFHNAVTKMKKLETFFAGLKLS